MADKIATRQDINNLKSGAFSSELNRCPTYSEIIAVGGLTINGSWANNQLVTLPSVSATPTPIETAVSPIAYPFIFNSNTYALGTNFTNPAAFYEDLIFPIGYVEFDWPGFQTDDLAYGPTGLSWDYDSSDIEWLNNSKILMFPVSAIGNSINATFPEGTNANMSVTSVSNSISVEFDDDFFNRLPSTSNMLAFIFSSENIPSDKYIGQIMYKNPEDDDILDSTHPLYKWSPDEDNAINQPPLAYSRETASNINIASPVRFTANQINTYTPSTGSVYKISQNYTDVGIIYPAYEPISHVGDGYENLKGYLKTGLKAINMDTITGNLNCTITFNFSKSLGDSVLLYAHYPKDGSPDNYTEDNIQCVVGSFDTSQGGEVPVSVETGKDISFSYTVDMEKFIASSYGGGTGFYFYGLYILAVDSNYDENVIGDLLTRNRLPQDLMDIYGYSSDKAQGLVDDNQLFKYIHKHIKVTVTDFDEYTIEVVSN